MCLQLFSCLCYTIGQQVHATHEVCMRVCMHNQAGSSSLFIRPLRHQGTQKVPTKCTHRPPLEVFCSLELKEMEKKTMNVYACAKNYQSDSLVETSSNPSFPHLVS